jgi:hypothetical protein
MRSRHDVPRTLAIAPTSRGLGYIVFERGRVPVDWGVKDARKKKTRTCLRKAGELMQSARPSLLVLEDTRDAGARRSKRIEGLIGQIATLGEQRGVRVVRCSRRRVLMAFDGAGNKDDVAAAVAELVPELEPRLPPRRRLWESEHYSMAIFEAAALALAHASLAETQVGEVSPNRRQSSTSIS